MISNELLERYHVGTLEFYIQMSAGNEEEGMKMFYTTFLAQTDYIPNKIIEAQALGVEIDQDYKEVLEARSFARSQL